MTIMDSRHWSKLQQLYSDQGLSLTAEAVRLDNRVRIAVGMENHLKHERPRNISFILTIVILKQ